MVENSNCLPIFAAHMVAVAQLVRVADCGSVGRGFEPHQPPGPLLGGFFYAKNFPAKVIRKR